MRLMQRIKLAFKLRAQPEPSFELSQEFPRRSPEQSWPALVQFWHARITEIPKLLLTSGATFFVEWLLDSETGKPCAQEARLCGRSHGCCQNLVRLVTVFSARVSQKNLNLAAFAHEDDFKYVAN